MIADLARRVTAAIPSKADAKQQLAHELFRSLHERIAGLPDSLAGRRYYQPTDQGFEERLRARMEQIRRISEGTPKRK